MNRLTALALSAISSLSLLSIVSAETLPQSKAGRLYEVIAAEKNAASWKQETIRSNNRNLLDAVGVCEYNGLPQSSCTSVIATSSTWIPVIQENNRLKVEIIESNKRVEIYSKWLSEMSIADQLSPATTDMELNICPVDSTPCDTH